VASYLFELPDLDFAVSFGDTNICNRCGTARARAADLCQQSFSNRAHLFRTRSRLKSSTVITPSRPWLTYTTSAEDPTCAAFLMPSYRTWSQVSLWPGNATLLS